MVSRALLLGTGRSPKRALGAVAAAFVAASLVVALPWEPIRTAGRYPIWAALVAVGLGGATYAGRHRGGLVALGPRAELLTGLRIGPVVALAVALALGSAAFALGAGLRRRSVRRLDA